MPKNILLALMAADIGGAETHVLELAKGLKDRGFHPVVVSAGGTYVQEFEQYGIPHYFAPLTSKNPIKMIQSCMTMKQVIQKEKIDVVHSHARIPSFILGVLQRFMHFPFVTSAHGTFKVTWLLRFLTNWGQRTIAVSGDIGEYLKKNYHLPSKHIIMSVNGINTDRFSKETACDDEMRELSLSREDFRIVHMSRLDDDTKDVAFTLLEAVKRLKPQIPNLKLIIVGSGKYYNELKREVDRANGDAPYVFMTGARTDVAELLNTADLFIGIARSALEAMACEKNVILAGISGYLGLFGEDKLEAAIATNFTCRGIGKTTADQLCLDILFFTQQLSEEEKKRLGAYSRQIVVENFSLDKMVDDAVNTYRESYARYKKINDYLILGYYGFSNSGDDSLLYSIVSDLRSFCPEAKICVLSKNPKSTREIYDVASVNRFHPYSLWHEIKNSQVLIAGSGNLIQDGTSSKSLYYYLGLISYAQKKGLRTMLFANGVGPVTKPKNQDLARRVIDRIDAVTLRESDSVDELVRMGVKNPNIKLTADPVFRLKPAADSEITSPLFHIMQSENQKYFGVSIRKWVSLKREFCMEVARICDYVSDAYGMTAVFLPMQRPSDYDYSQKVRSAMKTKSLILEEILSGEQLMGIISHMEFVIAMRLHALVYAVNVNVPVFGVEYNPKVGGFMRYAGIENYLPLDDFSLENSIEKFNAVWMPMRASQKKS